MTEEERFQPATRAQWRAWLEANHDRASGVWFVSYKQRTGKATVSYDDAVEEALCFGWIDGRMNPLDDERAMLRFSPRRPGGTWARSNKERVARLEAAGLMTEAGRRAIEAAKANGSWAALDDVEALVMPDDLATAVSAAGGRSTFDGWTASARKMALGWVAQARRPKTRSSRIEQVARVAGAGEPAANLWIPRRQR
jgi:uncharacterized protein YdeI (YjbR/CyaY-like superfamily)